VWLLHERIDIISYNCIELMWYCVCINRSQTIFYLFYCSCTFFITLLSASMANKDYIYLYRSGRPIDSYKTIVSTDDDDGQWKCRHLEITRISRNTAMYHQMCMSQPPYVKTEVGLLRDHSQHYTITGITKWLERLAFLVLVWVEKESSKKQKDLTCMNINNRLILL